ncbi:transposase [Acidomonas methanolica]|uniref:transposase n=1 Tax=Acidomonas methanolica TaxID=437 RepID=UPI001EF9FF93|nr:transposase [Acidomonas methanolica]
MEQPGLFDIDDRLKAPSTKADARKRLNTIVDCERFRLILMQVIPRSNGRKGSRPCYDRVFMRKVPIAQRSDSLSDERVELLIKDRLSLMQFQRLALSAPIPERDRGRGFFRLLHDDAKITLPPLRPIVERSIDISFFGYALINRKKFLTRNADFLAQLNGFLYCAVLTDRFSWRKERRKSSHVRRSISPRTARSASIFTETTIRISNGTAASNRVLRRVLSS